MTVHAARPTLSDDRLVAVWLFIVAGLVAIMVLVGGLTRLTDSGLSITEWRPITGALPPMSDAAWEVELEKYRQIPEYQLQNRGMSMAEFQVIYWWEWGHRQLGRLIGVAFALPLAAFWLTGRLRAGMKPWLLVLLALGGLQGFIGWWMVASGLTERVDVSHYRLATHKGMALIVFCGLLWAAFTARARAMTARWTPISLGAAVFAALVFGQAILGALVAGLDAGRVYTDWPLMNGAWLPAIYANGLETWAEAFEDRAAVQFNHRLGGYILVVLGGLYAVWAVRRRFVWGVAAGAAALAQAGLGVATLMAGATMALSAAHQVGGLALLALAVTAAWAGRDYVAEAGAARAFDTTSSSAITPTVS